MFRFVVQIAVLVIRLLMLFVLLGFAQTVRAGVAEVLRSREAYADGLKSYRAGRFEASLASFRQALRLRPHHPDLIYSVAALEARTGGTERALHLLQQVAKMGLFYDAQADSDFAGMQDTSVFQDIVAIFRLNTEPVSSSKVAFRLPEKDLISESVVFNPDTETFFVSSIHRRKILAHNATGTFDFATAARDGLFSVFGLRLDLDRGCLWACTSAIEEMQGFQQIHQGHSAVFQYDLASGRLQNKYLFLPSGDSSHLIGDLIIHTSGDVYLSDSRSNLIYTIKHNQHTASIFAGAGQFAGLQGLAFNNDESALFVADYAQGLFRIEMASLTMQSLNASAGICHLGIDGLYFFQNSLIGIQNGVQPNRVVRFHLNRSQSQITRATVLEANNPLFDEPTLGTVVGNTFYYVANSQWGAFDDAGKILPLAKLRHPVILQMKLD